MEIIKDAFEEGRSTKVDWDKSVAKKNEIKMRVALENFSTMSKRERLQIMPLHMICPESGKVLRTFGSRIAAARYICESVLNRPDKCPFSVTGNLEICMRAGWKSYGYYWQIADASYADKRPGPFRGKEIWYRVNGRDYIYESISKFASQHGLDRETVRKMLKPNLKNIPEVFKGKLVMYVNPSECKMVFSTRSEAASHFNCGVRMIDNIVAAGGWVNNYHITIGGK